MFPPIPCSICNESGHKPSKCPDLSSNTPPPPQKGDHDHDEDHLTVTNSGKCVAQDFNQTNGSNAGQLKPRSVINM